MLDAPRFLVLFSLCSTSAWWSLAMQLGWPSSSCAVSSISWLPMASSHSCSRAPSKVIHPRGRLTPQTWLVAETWTLLNLTIDFPDGTFLRTLATSLMDFNELSSIAALSQLLEVGLPCRHSKPLLKSLLRKKFKSFNLNIKNLNVNLDAE